MRIIGTFVYSHATSAAPKLDASNATRSWEKWNETALATVWPSQRKRSKKKAYINDSIRFTHGIVINTYYPDDIPCGAFRCYRHTRNRAQSRSSPRQTSGSSCQYTLFKLIIGVKRYKNGRTYEVSTTAADSLLCACMRVHTIT